MGVLNWLVGPSVTMWLVYRIGEKLWEIRLLWWGMSCGGVLVRSMYFQIYIGNIVRSLVVWGVVLILYWFRSRSNFM